MTMTRVPSTRLWVYYLLKVKVSYLLTWTQVFSIMMGLSLDLPNLTHIHILIAQSNSWHYCYVESLAAFLNYFVDKLVSNLMNYVRWVAGLGCLAELIQVELRVCRPQQWHNSSWQYKVKSPRYGLKPLRVLWKYGDQRSWIGCDVCLGPLWIVLEWGILFTIQNIQLVINW